MTCSFFNCITDKSLVYYFGEEIYLSTDFEINLLGIVKGAGLKGDLLFKTYFFSVKVEDGLGFTELLLILIIAWLVDLES